MAVVLPDGEMVAVRGAEFRGRPPFWGGPGTTMLLFVLVSLSLLGLWAARALSAPLSALAKAAETFSLDNAAAPLPERGPEEIRSVARALNAMRERITTLVDDRTKMLAAISHDLRTPITRMRLRTEFIEDETSRNQMLRDLDQMRAMLDSVLTLPAQRRPARADDADRYRHLAAIDRRPVRRHRPSGQLSRTGACDGECAAGRSAPRGDQSGRQCGALRRRGHDRA